MAGTNPGHRLYGRDVRYVPGEASGVVSLPPPATLPAQTKAISAAESDSSWRLHGFPQHGQSEAMPAKESQTTRLLVVDDHAIVRDGIVALLQTQWDMEVVGQAANGQQAVDMVTRLEPDVVLMDLLMPVMNGLEATRRIQARRSPPRVLILSQYDDEPNVTACLEAGASGFIPKSDAGPALLTTIRLARHGE